MNPAPPASAAGARPLVSLSIVSHGNAAEVSLLLESVAKHEPAARLQLILTANLGDDLPQVDASAWHSVVVLSNPRPRSFAGNHNAAFRHATAEFFCVINPDILFLEPVLQRLIAHLQAGRAHIIAPLAVDEDGRVQDSFRPLPSPLELFRRRALGQVKLPKIDQQDLINPDWIAGFFQVMPASIYARLGGMDEHFRMYMEDVDFCTRARLAGFLVTVDSGMRFQHGARRASRDDVRYFVWHMGSAIRFFTSSVYRQARLHKA